MAALVLWDAEGLEASRKATIAGRLGHINPELDAGFDGLSTHLDSLSAKLDSHHSEISLKLESLSQQAVQVRARPCVQAPQPLASWQLGLGGLPLCTARRCVQPRNVPWLVCH
jgi:hypothetical protein